MAGKGKIGIAGLEGHDLVVPKQVALLGGFSR